MAYRSALILLAALLVIVGAQLRPLPASAETSPALVHLGGGVVAPWAPITEGADHNFYGTTHDGGTRGAGTVFRLTPGGAVQTLYSFPNVTDGSGTDAPVIQGSDGRLYGTTYYNGGPSRCGTIFALNTDGSGFTVLHTFADTDGCNPWAGLLQGDDGYLYGTASAGGPNHLGVIFRLATDGSHYTVLHTFTSNSEGGFVHAGLIQGTAGRLYGTTSGGGTYGGGIVFALNPDGSGFTTVYALGGTPDTGTGSRADLIQGTDGALYGTTSAGGQYSGGTAFKVRTDGTGFTVLHAFGGPNDGKSPHAALLEASDGRLYGTTAGNGSNLHGSIFSMGLDGSGYTTVHAFAGSASDGNVPEAGPIQSDDGRIVATTTSGGPGNNGTIDSFDLGLPRPAPSIRLFTATSGPWDTQVLVHGSYLVGATSVALPGASASPNVSSGQWLRVAIPTGATTGALTVTTAGGTVTGHTFTVTPTITGLSTASGKYGEQVVITGTSFTGVKSVTFNGTAATYSVNSLTQITATVPQDSTTGAVAVTTGDGTATSAAPFTVTSLPPSVHIVSAALTHAVKGQTQATAALKSGEKGTFTLVYLGQNPGTHTPSATLTILKAGKAVGAPITMQPAMAPNGATTFTAITAVKASKKTLALQAQMTINLGPAHDSTTLAFSVVKKAQRHK
jgi:uncharacterized repeat protein (TIGR03803 family)